MANLIRKFKINDMPKDTEFAGMSFEQQIDGLRKIQEFQKDSKSTHLSQKRQSSAKAIREAVKLYDVKEYYCQFHDDDWYKDDSFEFWYR